jgi:tetratricopeptide (TPR) repeat protein
MAEFDSGRSSEAVEDFSRALELTPDDHGALLHRGIVLLQLKRNEEAVRDLRDALKNHPDCDEAFYHLAIAYVQLGDREAALDALQKAIDIHPPRRTEAQKAQEFDALRSEPRFKAVVAGKRRRG